MIDLIQLFMLYVMMGLFGGKMNPQRVDGLKKNQYPKVIGAAMTNLTEWEQASENPINVEQLDNLVKQVKDTEKLYKDMKSQASEIYKILESTKAELLHLLKKAGKKKYHVEGIGVAYIHTEYKVKMTKDLECKKVLYAFLKHKDILLPLTLTTIHSATLNSFYNQEAKNEEEKGNPNFSLPGIEPPTHIESVRIRKEK